MCLLLLPEVCCSLRRVIAPLFTEKRLVFANSKGIGENCAVTHEELVAFLEHMMSMSHVYQTPICCKIRANASDPLDNLAKPCSMKP